MLEASYINFVLTQLTCTTRCPWLVPICWNWGSGSWTKMITLQPRWAGCNFIQLYYTYFCLAAFLPHRVWKSEWVWVWWREEDIEVGKVLMQSPLRPLLGQDYYNFQGCIYIQCLEYIFRAFLRREANFYLVSCAARSAVTSSCVVEGDAGGEPCPWPWSVLGDGIFLSCF